MKRASKHSRHVPTDPLERAEENALAYRDMARAEARRLPDYESDDDESTARHDVPLPPIRIELKSVHGSEPPAKKQLTAGLTAIGTGIALAAVTGILALLQRCGH